MNAGPDPAHQPSDYGAYDEPAYAAGHDESGHDAVWAAQGSSSRGSVHRRGGGFRVASGSGGGSGGWRGSVWAKLAAGLLGGALLVAAGALAWQWPRLSSDAMAGASFGARIGCACHFVEGRPLAQCKGDFEPGMGLISLSEDAKAKSVTASFPLLASQTAQWRPDRGCVLQAWQR